MQPITSRDDLSFCDVIFFADVFDNQESMNYTRELAPVCLLILWVSWDGASG